jgi:hypothetical protein
MTEIERRNYCVYLYDRGKKVVEPGRRVHSRHEQVHHRVDDRHLAQVTDETRLRFFLNKKESIIIY